MGRTFKPITESEVEYAPDIADNRDDPEPFIVRLLPMTAAEVKDLERSMGDFTAAKMNVLDRATKHIRDVFKKRVVGVSRYSIMSRKGEVVEPKTGIELYEAIIEHGDAKEATVIDDIYEALRDHSKLRAGLPEALRSRSES